MYYEMYEQVTNTILMLQIIAVIVITLILIINARQKKSPVKIAIIEYDIYNKTNATITNEIDKINALVQHAFSKKGVIAVGVEIAGHEIAFYTDVKQVQTKEL